MELVLTEICEFLNNYFWTKKARGTFTISGGAIQLPWMKQGQYFRIIGSDLNEGVHQYPATELTDEEFDGEIWAMAVPNTVVALASEIKEWKAKYEKATSPAQSPFNSESFNNYSYSKSGSGSSGSGSNITWQDVYGGRLNKYRRLRGAR